MGRRSTVTILDVAKRAGVHPATVSRTISRPERVAPETRTRVEAVIAEMGFVPNRAARGLITGRTGNLAVIVPDITNPYFATMLRAADGAARADDMQVIVVDTGENADVEVSAARNLVQQVDGFLVASPRRIHLELDTLGEKPVVFGHRPGDGCRSIVMRTAGAVRAGVEHLVALGHTRVGFVGGPARSWAADERRRAVRAAAEEFAIELVDLGDGEPTFETGRAAGASVRSSKVTAVMAFNDQMALGVMSDLRERGISVPDDVSLIGCDDVPMAAMVSPALTTIHMPIDLAGRAAVELLANDDTADVELIAHLIVRDSTGSVS